MSDFAHGGTLWKDTPPCRSVEVGEVRGKKEKNPRVKETCGLFQWLDECPWTNSLEGVVVKKRKNPLCGNHRVGGFVIQPSCGWVRLLWEKFLTE